MPMSKTYVKAYQEIMEKVGQMAAAERDKLADDETQTTEQSHSGVKTAQYNAWDAISDFCALEQDAIQNAWESGQ